MSITRRLLILIMTLCWEMTAFGHTLKIIHISLCHIVKSWLFTFLLYTLHYTLCLVLWDSQLLNLILAKCTYNWVVRSTPKVNWLHFYWWCSGEHWTWDVLLKQTGLTPTIISKISGKHLVQSEAYGVCVAKGYQLLPNQSLALHCYSCCLVCF